MKCLVLIVAFMAVASARPDVSHLNLGSGWSNYQAPNSGYQYNRPPSTNYLPSQPSGAYLPSGRYYETKNVYYFADNQQIEQPRLRINIIPTNLRTHNTVYVKAPNYAPVVPEVHAPPAQIEDRTKVVVLVKKPEEQAPFNVYAAPPTKYGQPEVRVVKYDNEQEAKQAVSGSAEYLLGSNIRQVDNKQGFVKTLEGDRNTNSGYLGGYLQ